MVNHRSNLCRQLTLNVNGGRRQFLRGNKSVKAIQTDSIPGLYRKPQIANSFSSGNSIGIHFTGANRIMPLFDYFSSGISFSFGRSGQAISLNLITMDDVSISSPRYLGIPTYMDHTNIGQRKEVMSVRRCADQSHSKPFLRLGRKADLANTLSSSNSIIMQFTWAYKIVTLFSSFS